MCNAFVLIRAINTHMSEKPQSLGGTPYRLGTVLGRGAFGVVSQAYNSELGTFFAIKQVELRDRESLKAIETEIGLLRSLNHPNIVRYVDAFQLASTLYIVLELLESGSLLHVLKRFGHFSESVASRYTLQVLSGLEFLHDQGVIHRDLKAANVLLSKDGAVKLADFGVAANLQTSGVERGIVGSAYWCAPELIEMTSSPSSACDIWSCGCTVVEILAGAPPYAALAPMSALFRIVTDDAPPIPSTISSHCQDFLVKCFQKEPRLRASARDLARHPWLAAWRVEQEQQTSSLSLLNPSGNLNIKDALGSKGSESSIAQQGVGPQQPPSTNEQLQRFQEGDETFDDFVFDNTCKLVLQSSYEESSTLSNSLLDPRLSDDDDNSEDGSDWGMDLAIFPSSFSSSSASTPDDLAQMLATLREPNADLSPPVIVSLRVLLMNSELRSIFVAKHGVLPLLGLMELNSCACVAILREVLELGDAKLTSQAAVLGLASSTVHLAANDDKALRLECARMMAILVRHSAATLQILVACGGVGALTRLLAQKYPPDGGDSMHFEIIGSVASTVRFALTPQQNPSNREAGALSVNDLCRLFAKEGLLNTLGKRLNSLLKLYSTHSTSLSQSHCASGSDVLATGSQRVTVESSLNVVGCLADILVVLFAEARSGNAVCSQFASEKYLLRGIIALLVLQPEGGKTGIHSTLVLPALKIVHSLSMDPCTLESLEVAGAIPALVKQLEGNVDADSVVESYAIQALFYMLRVSFHRQNVAAACGLVAHLICVAQDKNQVKQFALPMLCDLAHASHACREQLKEHGAAAFFLSLSSDGYWRTPALNSLAMWHKEDRAFLDHFLTSDVHLEKLVTFFCHASWNAESALGPFLAMLTKSPLLCTALSLKEAFAARALSHLTSSQAIVRRGALQIFALLFAHHPRPKSFATAIDLRRCVEGLCRDEEHLLVTETALALLTSIDSTVAEPEELAES